MTSHKIFSTRFRHAMIFACALLGFSLAGWSQPDGMGGPPDGPPPGGPGMERSGPNTEQELKKLTQLLTLTSEQQNKVKTILADRNQQIDTLFKEQFKQPSGDQAQPEPPSRESMANLRTQIKSIREDAKNKITALLTADQKTKFLAYAKKSDKSAQQDMDDDMPPPPPDGDGPPGGPAGGPGGGGPPGA